MSPTDSNQQPQGKKLCSAAADDNEPLIEFTPPYRVFAQDVAASELPKPCRMNINQRILKIELILPELHWSPQAATTVRPKRLRKWPLRIFYCVDDYDPTEQSILSVTDGTQFTGEDSEDPVRSATPERGFRGRWIRGNTHQQPDNGELWYRISSQRVQISVLLELKSNTSQKENSSDYSVRSSATSLYYSTNYSTSSLSLPECPRYYYWDSSILRHPIDVRSSRLIVGEEKVVLLLTIASSNRRQRVWMPNELRSLESRNMYTHTSTKPLQLAPRRSVSQIAQDRELAEKIDYPDHAYVSDGDHSPYFTVVIERTYGQSLGLTLVEKPTSFTGGTVNPFRCDTGIFIKGIIKGGLAEQSGKLRVGDQLLAVNSVSVLQTGRNNTSSVKIRARTLDSTMDCNTKKNPLLSLSETNTINKPGMKISENMGKSLSCYSSAYPFAVRLLRQAIGPVILSMHRQETESMAGVGQIPHDQTTEVSIVDGLSNSRSEPDKIHRNATEEIQPPVLSSEEVSEIVADEKLKDVTIPNILVTELAEDVVEFESVDVNTWKSGQLPLFPQSEALKSKLHIGEAVFSEHINKIQVSAVTVNEELVTGLVAQVHTKKSVRKKSVRSVHITKGSTETNSRHPHPSANSEEKLTSRYFEWVGERATNDLAHSPVPKAKEAKASSDEAPKRKPHPRQAVQHQSKVPKMTKTSGTRHQTHNLPKASSAAKGRNPPDIPILVSKIEDDQPETPFNSPAVEPNGLQSTSALQTGDNETNGKKIGGEITPKNSGNLPGHSNPTPITPNHTRHKRTNGRKRVPSARQHVKQQQNHQQRYQELSPSPQENAMQNIANNLNQSKLQSRLSTLEEYFTQNMSLATVPLDSPTDVKEVEAFHDILESLTDEEWKTLLHVVMHPDIVGTNDQTPSPYEQGIHSPGNEEEDLHPRNDMDEEKSPSNMNRNRYVKHTPTVEKKNHRQPGRSAKRAQSFKSVDSKGIGKSGQPEPRYSLVPNTSQRGKRTSVRERQDQ
ncbi:unnamed protein product [Calicophoron daubneyi]|uniref:PDZ domain-containing protein n=1 Tax=Calicophoron daubneyi TaxID=300641 RepID=A0AAV2TV48_CALDB